MIRTSVMHRGILTAEIRARKASEAAVMRGDTAGPPDEAPAEPTNGGNGGNGHSTPKPATAALTDEPPAIPAKLQGLELGPACAMWEA